MARRVTDEVLAGLRVAALLPENAVLASLWHRRLEYGYPTPFSERDELLEEIDTQLLRHNVWSRGRFGAWKYEVSNQDHSLMLGVEAVNHILSGTVEETYHYPGTVNSMRK